MTIAVSSYHTKYINIQHFSISLQLLQENQRPPVYNAEDYIVSLKKFGRRTSGTTNGESKSIYDTSEEKHPNSRAATLPAKHSAFK